MLLTGLWVLEGHPGSHTPICFHAQGTTDRLGALSSSDFQGASDVDGEDKIDAKASATCAVTIVWEIPEHY